MADFVESIEYKLQIILHNFLVAQHGKGPADFEAGLLQFELIVTLINSTLFGCFSTWFTGQAKTKASIAATHGLQIDNAQQLHAFLEANHSEVTNEQHECLHEVRGVHFNIAQM